jgi:SAM-dependent methyltransferase
MDVESAEAFWDRLFAARTDYSRVDFPDGDDPVLNAALAFFGDVAGKTVVDLGCGSGGASLFFASHGAHVTAVDTSEVAIANLRAFCAEHELTRVTTLVASAFDTDAIGGADFVFGSMILHHVEPFDDFAASLERLIARPDGRGFFYENNAGSSLLMWCRRNIVGRLWVPKYGDPDESPLASYEVDLLRRRFHVTVEYPQLLFFQLIGAYLLRERLTRQLEAIDKLLFKIKPLRKYSYRQYVYLRNS